MNYFFRTSLTVRFTVCFMLLQMGSFGCTRNEAPKVPAKTVPKSVLAVPTLLATLAADEKPDAPVDDQRHAKSPSSENQTSNIVIELDKRGRGFAYIARDKDGVHVVHNGEKGKNYSAVDSSTLRLSSDGQRVAYGAKSGDKWFVVVDGKEFGPYDEKGPPVFSPDCRHVAFEAQLGNSWHVFVDGRKSAGAVSYFDKPIFSADSSRLVRFENTNDESIYRVLFSDLSFDQPFTLTLRNLASTVSEDMSRIAFVDNVGGKKQVKLIKVDQPDKPLLGSLYDEVRAVGFSKDAQHLSYVAKKGADFFLVLDNREEPIPSGEYPWPPVVRPDGKGVGLIIVGPKGASLHQAFVGGSARIPTPQYKECADLAYSPDGTSHAYVAIRDERFLIVTNGKEGPLFDRVISPQFSPDGKYLVYRARQDNKRFVVVADATGRIIKEHPRYERVFETVFTEDGKSVAYGVKEGNQLLWKVEKL